MYDVNSTDVFFKSCYTLVPFQNPSDAAIARLSAAGFTSLAIQTILDLIVFNPVFNPKEVTLKSAGSIDETIADYRRKQALQRSIVNHTVAQDVGGPPALVVNLVASHIYEGILPFDLSIRAWGGPPELLHTHSLLRNMSLVHRSWTNIAQDLLFQRLKIRYRLDHGRLRRYLQHPFLSRIREFIYEVPFKYDEDEDDETTVEAIDYGAQLLNRLGPLRYLSLRIRSSGNFFEEPFKIRSSEFRIYSLVSRHLPNLKGLWLIHAEVEQLRRCIKSIQDWRLDIKPITLRKLHLSIDDGNYSMGAHFSPIILQSHDIHNHLGCSEGLSDAQIFELEKIRPNETRDIFIRFNEEGPMEDFCNLLTDMHMSSFVLGGAFAGIRRLAVHYPPENYPSKLLDIREGFSVRNSETEVKNLLSRLLDKCTALIQLDIVNPNFWNHDMAQWLFSDLPTTVRVLSIYFPDPIRHKLVCDTQGLSRYMIHPNYENIKKALEQLVDNLCNRTGGSAVKRLKVTFCGDIEPSISKDGLEITLYDVEGGSYEIGVPRFLLPVHKTCSANGIEFMMRESA